MERKLPSPDNPRLGIKGASKNRESLQIFKSFIYLYFFIHTQKEEKNSATDTIKSRACRNTNRCKGKRNLWSTLRTKSASQSQWMNTTKWTIRQMSKKKKKNFLWNVGKSLCERWPAATIKPYMFKQPAWSELPTRWEMARTSTFSLSFSKMDHFLSSKLKLVGQKKKKNQLWLPWCVMWRYISETVLLGATAPRI